LVLVGATAQAGWLFVLAAGVLGLVLGSFVAGHRLGAVEVARSGPQRSRVGDEVRMNLLVRNTAASGVPLFVVEDLYPAFDRVRVAVDRLPPRGEAEIELVRRASKRGEFTEGSTILTSGSPFGLARSRRRTVVRSELTVVPRWVELTSFPILEPSSSPSDVLHERARTGAGQEYLGIREYRPGDPLRSVHWRSTARAGRLIVREYEQEIASRVGLVMSGSDHGEGPESSFETLVSAVASVGLYALSTGHPVHAARFGTDGIEYMGEPGKHDLLDWLATTAPHDEPLDPLVDHMLQRVGRRGTIVICGTTSGAAGASLGAAVTSAQRAGARAIVVAARSSSWDQRVPEEESSLTEVGGGRAPVRWLVAGEDLVSCLAG
jgi:uncharacterized protein (DUF58 family)